MDDKMSGKGQKNFFCHPNTQKSHLDHVYRRKKSKKRHFGRFSKKYTFFASTPPSKKIFTGGGNFTKNHGFATLDAAGVL